MGPTHQIHLLPFTRCTQSSLTSSHAVVADLLCLRQLPNCFENYCAGLVPSFNASLPNDAEVHGGFLELSVVDERYIVWIPDGVALDHVAPLLCAGVTVYCLMPSRPG
uniref:Uncharacterized protein n=1 Tax=Oryza brachyantha TaxID=4533 RepID=J3MVK9_ORYBR